jgi:RNA polymerase sigma factor (sigma-70 family)
MFLRKRTSFSKGRKDNVKDKNNDHLDKPLEEVGYSADEARVLKLVGVRTLRDVAERATLKGLGLSKIERLFLKKLGITTVAMLLEQTSEDLVRGITDALAKNRFALNGSRIDRSGATAESGSTQRAESTGEAGPIRRTREEVSPPPSKVGEARDKVVAISPPKSEPATATNKDEKSLPPQVRKPGQRGWSPGRPKLRAVNEAPRDWTKEREVKKEKKKSRKLQVTGGMLQPEVNEEEQEEPEGVVSIERRAELRKLGFAHTDEILHLPVPTDAEEGTARAVLGEKDYALFQAIRLGTPNERIRARHRLVQRHMKMIYWTAWKEPYRSVVDLKTWDCAMDRDDLTQYMTSEGLMKAIEKFDYTNGYRFSTYAWSWLRQAATRYIYNAGLVRVPVHMVEAFNAHQKVVTKLTRAKGGEYPSAAEVQMELGLTDEQYATLSHSVQIITARGNSWLLRDNRKGEKHQHVSGEKLLDSFGAKLTQAFESAQVEEGSVADRVRRPEEYIDARTLQVKLSEFLAKTDVLVEAERFVLTWRFGLNGEAPESLEQIGERMGLTRERIRQREATGLKKLRDSKLWENVAQPYWSEAAEIAPPERLVEKEEEEKYSEEEVLDAEIKKVSGTAEQEAQVPATNVISLADKQKVFKDEGILQAVFEVVCLEFECMPGQIMMKTRKAEIVLPRQYIVYLLRTCAGWSLPKIGKHLDRDHTTILHGCETIESLVKSDKKAKRTLEKLLTELKVVLSPATVGGKK